MQPTFLPWIGYFDMMDQVDHFILYDDVQLAKRSWQIRNRIKTAQGELFLTVPVKKTKNRDELLISEAEISYEENWQSKHLKSIEIAYGKAPYFSEVFHFICGLYSAKERFLGDFNSQFIISVSEKEFNTSLSLLLVYATISLIALTWIMKVLLTLKKLSGSSLSCQYSNELSIK